MFLGMFDCSGRQWSVRTASGSRCCCRGSGDADEKPAVAEEVITATEARTTDFVLITTILAVVGLVVLGIGMIVMAVAGGGL
jgi:hypothetical protein